MNRRQFDHVIRAAASVVGEDDIVVIGSQSILGAEPEAPEAMLRSMEADVYPKESPGRAIEIDGALGDGSPFHQTFGYYAHGVGPESVVAPLGWEERRVVVEVVGPVGGNRTIRAHCPEPHDLVLSKCAANRERDWDFARAALATGVVELGTLLERVPGLPITETEQTNISTRLKALT